MQLSSSTVELTLRRRGAVGLSFSSHLLSDTFVHFVDYSSYESHEFPIDRNAYALQRTGAAVTAPASCLRLSPAAQEPRQPRPSLSLGSLGVATRYE